MSALSKNKLMCAVLHSLSSLLSASCSNLDAGQPLEPRIETPMSAPLTFYHPTGRSTAILCIDDEPPALLARTAQLEAVGYRVFSALSADEAVQLFVAHQVDLILSSIVVLGASAENLSIFMRQVRPEVPVVLLSRTERLHATLLKQGDACIGADASENDLLACLRQVLEKQFSRTQAPARTATHGTQ